MESDESNNEFSTSISVLGKSVDFTIPTGSINPASVHAGETFDVFVDITNIGQDDIDTTIEVEYFLSADGTIDANDISLSREYYYEMYETGMVFNFSEMMYLPLDVDPGDYSVLVKVDSEDRFEEEDETNNVLNAGTLNVQSPDIDFTIDSLMTVANATAGTFVDVDGILTNNGTTGVSTYVYIDGFISDDTNLDGQDWLYWKYKACLLMAICIRLSKRTS